LIIYVNVNQRWEADFRILRNTLRYAVLSQDNYQLGVMDNYFETLGTIVEFSIGLAGFIGIVAVVRQFRGIDSNLAQFRFKNLLVTAFVPGFFALPAMTLASFEVDDFSSLRYASGAFATFLILNFVFGWDNPGLFIAGPNIMLLQGAIFFSISDPKVNSVVC
jgi:hypothetical protein